MTCDNGLCTSSQKEIKTIMKTPIHFNSKKITSLLNVRSMHDHVFSWTTIIATCVVIVDVRYTISMRVEWTMTTSIKVQKSFLVIRISIYRRMWQEWESSFGTWAPLSKTIIVIIFGNVSWVNIHSFSQRHQSKWIPRSSMVWSYWHHDTWTTIVCDMSRWVCNDVRKWAENRWNVGVVGQTTN
jgi:hypothetical protein